MKKRPPSKKSKRRPKAPTKSREELVGEVRLGLQMLVVHSLEVASTANRMSMLDTSHWGGNVFKMRETVLARNVAAAREWEDVLLDAIKALGRAS